MTRRARQAAADPSRPHRHSKAECLKVLRQLSNYLENDAARDVCREIRRHLGACPRCELFLTSLRHTVTLCRHADSPTLSRVQKARLGLEILAALGLH